MSPMSVSLFHAQRVQGVVPAIGHAQIRTGLADDVEYARRELGGYVQLPTQFTNIGNPAGTDAGVPQIDVLRCAEGERCVGEIARGQPRQQLARELGPITLRTAKPEVTSDTWARSVAAM